MLPLSTRRSRLSRLTASLFVSYLFGMSCSWTVLAVRSESSEIVLGFSAQVSKLAPRASVRLAPTCQLIHHPSKATIRAVVSTSSDLSCKRSEAFIRAFHRASVNILSLWISLKKTPHDLLILWLQYHRAKIISLCNTCTAQPFSEFTTVTVLVFISIETIRFQNGISHKFCVWICFD